MSNIREEIIERRRQRTPEGSRVAMRIDIEFDGEILGSVGGMWDRQLRDFDGEAETGVVVRPHPGQVAAVQWFILWLAVHAGRRDNPPDSFDADDDAPTDPSEVFSALFAGGRRGGKTWIAAVCCAMYAVMFPDAIIWVISSSRGRDDSKPDEVRRYMAALLAPEWVAQQTANGWVLINGSQIMLKSAYVGADPDAIKEGEAHLIWMNEAQKMKRRVYIVARGAISDRSGLVLCCANPPVEAKDEQWVADFAADAESGRRASVYLHFNPLQNPHINRKALLEIKREVDLRTFQIEVEGRFMAPVDAVAYNWNRVGDDENEQPAPRPTYDAAGLQYPCPRTGLIDVTAEFLEVEEEGVGLRDLIGCDVQVHPHMGGPVYRFFAPPGAEIHRDNELLVAWIVGEAVLEAGDEADWTKMLHDRKFDPATTLIVCDATAEYQHSRRRNTDSPPPEWKGKGSFDLFREGGFMRIVPPSRRFRRKNPDILDRIRSFTSLIKPASGPRRLFCDRDKAPKTAQAIREWKTKNGKPSRTQEHAHLGDAASYPIIRLFPRIFRSGNTDHVDTITERVDKGQEPSPFGSPARRASRGRGGRGL